MDLKSLMGFGKGFVGKTVWVRDVFCIWDGKRRPFRKCNSPQTEIAKSCIRFGTILTARDGKKTSTEQTEYERGRIEAFLI